MFWLQILSRMLLQKVSVLCMNVVLKPQDSPWWRGWCRLSLKESAPFKMSPMIQRFSRMEKWARLHLGMSYCHVLSPVPCSVPSYPSRGWPWQKSLQVSLIISSCLCYFHSLHSSYWHVLFYSPLPSHWKSTCKITYLLRFFDLVYFLCYSCSQLTPGCVSVSKIIWFLKSLFTSWYILGL